jgi:hypothetical protein
MVYCVRGFSKQQVLIIGQIPKVAELVLCSKSW